MNLKHTSIKRALYVTLLVTCSVMDISGQDTQKKREMFLGIQPTITVEEFYGDGEFDFNLLPLAWGLELKPFMDLKVLPMVNWHFGGGSHLRHIGMEINLPIYLMDISKRSRNQNFFLAPLIAYSYAKPDKANEVTLGVEAGWAFQKKDNRELKIGIQEGATIFWGNPALEKTINHFGVKLSFGKWF